MKKCKRDDIIALTFFVVIALLMVALILCTATAEAARLNHEKIYQEVWCDMHDKAFAPSETEHRLRDGTRVDCMAKIDGVLYAIEFDFADKWAEAIGQALYYARMTGREPAVVLIVEDFERDMKYIDRLNYAIIGAGIRVFLTR